MSFLIFLPDCSGPDPQHLHAAGLGDLLRPDDRQPASVDLVGATPTGQPGQLWGWLTDGPQTLAYRPETQTWLAAKPQGSFPAGRYWIGWDTATPPAPTGLQRSVMIPGFLQELGDGQLWLVPNAGEVPQRYDLDAGGAWQTTPLERYRAFVDRTVWAFDFCQRMIESDYTLGFPQEAIDYAIEALGWNYRLPRELAAHLGILQPANLYPILAASTDLERLREIAEGLKKTG